jgi:3-hydroxyisobutyrate dehydrogenase-like beta-hydroxyacid dehydrogenase
MKLAFLGLGVMGFPMAGHLSTRHDVVVYNRSAAKMDQWLQTYKGTSAPTPAEAARDADMVFACVGNDDDVREVFMGAEGAVQTMKAGTIFIDHTTASATLARDLSDIAQSKQIEFLDAPVSGGQAGAEAGKLSIMVGGDAETFARAEPVLKIYAKAIAHMGPVGSGQLAKMVNQICIAGVIQGLAEGLAFAQKAGLDGERLIDVISHGAAGSWQMENRGKTMLQDRFDFGFAVDWIIKDLDICLDEAKRNDAKLPVTSQIADYYRELSRNGDGRMDTSSLIRRLHYNS